MQKKCRIVNFRNAHVWADENPQALWEARYQDKISINVWYMIIGDQLIEP